MRFNRRERANTSLVRREAVQQTVAAGADQVLLAATAIGPLRRMRRIPGFDRRIGRRSVEVGMSEHRRPLGTRRPVLAGAIVGWGERSAVRLRPRENIVPVRLVSEAIDEVALFGQRRLLVDIVAAVQLRDILCCLLYTSDAADD